MPNARRATSGTEPTVALPPAPANDPVDVAPIKATERKGSFLKGALLTVLALMVGIPTFAIFWGPRHKEADAGLPPRLVTEISQTQAAGEKDGALPEKIEIEPTPRMTTVNKTEMVQSGPVTSEKAEPAAIRYTKTDANLREGPGTKFTVIIVVPKGGQVSVMETKGGWSRVQVDVNTSGWMANSTIVKD